MFTLRGMETSNTFFSWDSASPVIRTLLSNSNRFIVYTFPLETTLLLGSEL